MDFLIKLMIALFGIAMVIIIIYIMWEIEEKIKKYMEKDMEK